MTQDSVPHGGAGGASQPYFVFVSLNMRLDPLTRGERFEDPLQEVLANQQLGEVSGGGTSLSESGEIAGAGLDLVLYDLDRGLRCVATFLERSGAARGTQIEYSVDGEARALPAGDAEGLALYLNGTDLPAQVYRDCDINLVRDTLNVHIEGHGTYSGYWEGPTETALYFYGPSFRALHEAMAPFLASYPLCQRARVVQIA